MDLLLSARTFMADEAKELGLISQVFHEDDLLEETLRYARDIATNVPGSSLAVIKQQVNDHPQLSLNEALGRSNKLMQMSTTLPNFKEGIKSFMKKRVS